MGRLLKTWAILTLVSIAVCAAPVWSQFAEIETEITDYDQQIRQSRDLVKVKQHGEKQLEEDIVKIQADLNENERKLHPLKGKVESLKIRSDNAKRKLETALTNPDLVPSDKLETLHKESQSVRAEQTRAENELTVIAKEVETLQKRLEVHKKRKELIEQELEDLKRRIWSLVVKKPIVIEGIGECVMHEDITPKDCKEEAFRKAKRDAVEKGGSSIVQSLTEVNLSEVKKDEIHVETTATIRQLEILQPPSHVPEGELGKYVSKIRAVVQSEADVMSQKTEPKRSNKSKQSLYADEFKQDKVPNRKATGLKVPGAKTDLNPYLERVQMKIRNLWDPPQVYETGKGLAVVIKFRVLRSGRISYVATEQSSGDDSYDSIGKNAVLNADPLPAFPPEITDNYLDAYFTFTIPSLPQGIDRKGSR